MYDTPDFDKQMNMTQGEKAIERLRNRASFMAEDYHRDLDIIEKSLKALGIIKNKCPDIGWIIESKDFSYYLHSQRVGLPITKEEYDLLREVLLWTKI